MKLSFKEAEQLTKLSRSINEAFNTLEDMRPGGGFTECVDGKKECKCCGAPAVSFEEFTRLKTPRDVKLLVAFADLEVWVRGDEVSSVNIKEVLRRLKRIRF